MTVEALRREAPMPTTIEPEPNRCERCGREIPYPLPNPFYCGCGQLSVRVCGTKQMPHFTAKEEPDADA